MSSSDTALVSSIAEQRECALADEDSVAIRVQHLRKGYQIYDTPRDRLKQFLWPRFQRLLGRKTRQFFREFLALKDISFEVRKGETVGIVGRNGSGKSTLLQIICGTLHPNSGNVQVRGRVAALLELGSGFNPEFTGRENVYMNARILGLTHEQTSTRFSDIESFADIGDFIDQPVKTYSSGMTVRLAFAVIAHVDADILVIDEALAVGDAFFTQKCMRFLRNFMKTGTILFVSHDTATVKGLCSRAIWLEKGELLQEGAPKEVCDLYLEAFYEAQQGGRTTTRLREVKAIDQERPWKDQRLEFINASNLRNDLRVFDFDPDAASFGKGGARIDSVEFSDRNGAPLAWVVGGEQITLRIAVTVAESLDAPIVGFFIKDRLGQTLFGDNTYLTFRNQSISCAAGAELRAGFTFTMPTLPPGEYSVNVAVANGTQENHIQHHWIHDAMFFRSESSSVVRGLVGIPMQHIELDVVEAAT